MTGRIALEQPPTRPRLWALRGLPGCGKTSWARAHVAHELGRGRPCVRVNRDALRDQLHPGIYLGQQTEQAVTTAAYAQIRALLASHTSVVVDDTNLYLPHLRELQELAVAAGARFEVHDLTGVPLDVCIRRDAGRPPTVAGGPRDGRAVGEQVIRDLHAQYIAGGVAPLDPPAPAAATAALPHDRPTSR